MRVARISFVGTESDGTRVPVERGRTLLADDHEFVQRWPHRFEAADESPRFGATWRAWVRSQGHDPDRVRAVLRELNEQADKGLVRGRF